MPHNRAVTPIKKDQADRPSNVLTRPHRAGNTRRAVTPWNERAQKRVHKGVGADERRKPQDKKRQSYRESRRRHAEEERWRRGWGEKTEFTNVYKDRREWFPILTFIRSTQSQVQSLLAVIIYNRHLERDWMTKIKNDRQFNNVTGAKEHLSNNA